MSANHLIEAQDLIIRHGSNVALNGITLNIPRGSVTALLGRNGAGKSSFLDACLGLIPPSAGRLEVLGMSPQKNGPQVRKRLGYVEADPHYDGHEKIGSLLAMAAAMRPETNQSFRDDLAINMKLSMNTRARELSRGQRTKLALCLALAHQPELLILDEPFDGLDAGARHEILAEIIHQVDETRGIVIASHDLDEVERIADRVAIIHEGTVVLEGTLDEVRGRIRRWSGPASKGTTQTLRDAGFNVEARGDDLLVYSLDKSAPDIHAFSGCDNLQLVPTNSLEEVFLASTSGHSDGDKK
ncbi:MAG: ABC-2 type transport system ATP-binding protein [Planctomycetota bacterium]|jgi:ABC-2 type transport system ATP-binding protein